VLDHQQVGQPAVKTTRQPCMAGPSAQRRLILRRSRDGETPVTGSQPCPDPAAIPWVPGTRRACPQHGPSQCRWLAWLPQRDFPRETSPAGLSWHHVGPWPSQDGQGCFKQRPEPEKLSTRVLQPSWQSSA